MIGSMIGPRISTPRSSDKAEAAPRALRGEIVAVPAIRADDRQTMYALFASYFEAGREAFGHDLDEKEWAIILRDSESGAIAGFSTLMRFQVAREQRSITVFFSGDTVVDRAYWGSLELPRLWAAHVFGCAAELPDDDVYWFLISAGFRTYRYLTVFFREFFPSPEKRTPPAEQALLDSIATARFKERYDPRTGTVHLANPTPLRSGISDPDVRALRKPDVRFFLAMNPGHAAGDELACLVRISYDNLTPAGLRMLQSS
jgi:hypothetical protein